MHLFTDIKSSYLALIQDVSKINDHIRVVYSLIGKTIPFKGRQHSTVWEALAEVFEKLENLESEHLVTG